MNEVGHVTSLYTALSFLYAGELPSEKEGTSSIAHISPTRPIKSILISHFRGPLLPNLKIPKSTLPKTEGVPNLI